MKKYELTSADAALLLGVKERDLALWRKKGVGPSYIWFFHSVKYNRAELDEYIKESSKK